MENIKLKTDGLNGLRAIAAFVVMTFCHYALFDVCNGLPLNFGVFMYFWTHGEYFVDLFFVISGFVINYNYKVKIKREELTFLCYIKKRIHRFYPIMIASLFFVLLLQILYSTVTGGWFAADKINANTIFTFILNIFCLQSLGLKGNSFNASSWYLSAVFIMYIIYYFFTYKYRKYDNDIVIYMISIVFGIILVEKGYPPYFAIMLNHRAIIGFFAGCLICELCKYFSLIKNGGVMFATYGMILFCIISFFTLESLYGETMIGCSPTIIWGLLIWPMIIFLVINVKFIGNILSIKLFQWLSKISICVYLLHYPIMIMIDLINRLFDLELNYSSDVVFGIYVVMVVSLSALYYYISKLNISSIFNKHRCGDGNEKE